MLPVSPDGFIVPPIQCDPHNPFARPDIGPLNQIVQPCYQVLCGLLINEIVSTASYNPVRKFCFNLCARNNWFSQEFAEICRVAHDRIVYYMVTGRVRDINQALSAASTEIPAAYAGHLLNVYRELQSYCDPNVCDMAWKNSAAFDNIVSEHNNMNQHYIGNQGHHSGQYHQQSGHMTTVPNSMVSGNGGVYSNQNTGYSYPSVGHNSDPTRVNRTSSSRFDNADQQARDFRNDRFQNDPPPQHYPSRQPSENGSFSHRYSGGFQSEQVAPYAEEILEMPIDTGPSELYVNNGTEMANADKGTTFHGVFFPIDFTARYKTAVDCASELAATVTRHAEAEEGEIILQEHGPLIIASSLSDGYTQLSIAKRELQAEREFELMYRGVILTAREIHTSFDLTDFITGLEKTSTMSSLVSLMKSSLESENLHIFDFVTKLDNYLRQRINHWLKHTALLKLRLEGVCEDWQDMLNLLNESYSSTYAQLLSKFANSMVSELKALNEEYRSVIEEECQPVDIEPEPVEGTVEELTEPKPKKKREIKVFLLGDFVSVTQTFLYNKELGYQFEHGGSIPKMETAPVLTTVLSSISNYRKATQWVTTRDFFVTADGSWYEYILNHEKQEYIVYPAVFSFI